MNRALKLIEKMIKKKDEKSANILSSLENRSA